MIDDLNKRLAEDKKKFEAMHNKSPQELAEHLKGIQLRTEETDCSGKPLKSDSRSADWWRAKFEEEMEKRK